VTVGRSERQTGARVDSRVALVTGAARGIGAATVTALCAKGYRVMAIDACSGSIGPEGVNYALASEDDLRGLETKHPDQVLTRIVDVRDESALKEAAATSVERFGRLDAAVAAAAVIVGGQSLWETPAKHFRTLLDVDVVGVWNTAAATIPHMLAGSSPHGCRFVAVSSTAGDQGLFHLAGYSAAKHAVVGLTRGLAADLVGTGVTAVTVSPGSTNTHMLQATADLYGLVDVEHFAASQHIRRLLTSAEVAATIAFCCSEEGAALNGSIVSATGGFST
jgi:SDR family mycofactocin-dependent oxidoreductase